MVAWTSAGRPRENAAVGKLHVQRDERQLSTGRGSASKTFLTTSTCTLPKVNFACNKDRRFPVLQVVRRREEQLNTNGEHGTSSEEAGTTSSHPEPETHDEQEVHDEHEVHEKFTEPEAVEDEEEHVSRHRS